MKAQHVQELEIYQRAFELQQTVFTHSKDWPREESYSLVGQIRRASRGVGANLSHAWGRRDSARDFQTKLTDAEADLLETRHWLRTATACKYIDSTAALTISEMADRVSILLADLIQNHESLVRPTDSAAVLSA